MITSDFRKNAAILINNLIKADGAIRREEVQAAYDYLNAQQDDGEPRPWATGDNAVLGANAGMDLSTAIGALRYAPEEDRMDLIAAMWEIAGSDGEIVEMEEEFVANAANALDLSPSTVEIIRPAGFGALQGASDGADRAAV